MRSRRRPALAKERRSRHVKNGRDLGGGRGGNFDDVVLDPVDREVGPFPPVLNGELPLGRVKQVGKLLPTELLNFPNLLDPSSYKRAFIAHPSRLSEIDSSRNHVSAADSQLRDSVSAMPSGVPDLPFHRVEAWMRELGLVTDDKPDWKRILKEAGIGATQQYVVKNRWGENPGQMADVRAVLEKHERKRSEPTPTGAVVFALDEWAKIGRALANDPKRLQEEIARLAPIAEALAEIADARRRLEKAESRLLSPTPEPKKPRK